LCGNTGGARRIEAREELPCVWDWYDVLAAFQIEWVVFGAQLGAYSSKCVEVTQRTGICVRCGYEPEREARGLGAVAVDVIAELAWDGQQGAVGLGFGDGRRRFRIHMGRVCGRYDSGCAAFLAWMFVSSVVYRYLVVAVLCIRDGLTSMWLLELNDESIIEKKWM
jgi:hypothetical protein